MTNINIGAALTSVSTLASLPIDNPVIHATLADATDISVASGMVIGQELTVIVTPSADFTQTIPTENGFTSTIGDSVTFKNGVTRILHVRCYGENLYIISSDDINANAVNGYSISVGPSGTTPNTIYLVTQ